MSLTYVEDGDLATPANMNAWLNQASGQRHDVTFYGAVGDGVTNDTTAIQAALDAAPEGGHVHFPEGHYIITAQLLITSKSLLITGVPAHPFVDSPLRGGSVVQLNTHNVHAFRATYPTSGGGTGSYHLTLRDIGFYGPGPTAGKTGHGVYITCTAPAGTTVYVTLDRVGARRFNQHGIFLGGGIFGGVVGNVWADTCGMNGFRWSRRTSTLEGSGSDTEDVSGELSIEHLSVFSCGSLGTTNDTQCGVYFAPGGAVGSRIARMTSNTNTGSGAIISRCIINGEAWNFESNGGSQGTVPAVVFGDEIAGYPCYSGFVSTIDVYYHTGGSGYAGPGIRFTEDSSNVHVHAPCFADTTSANDIEVVAGCTDIHILGYKRVQGTAGGVISDAGTRTVFLTHLGFRLPTLLLGDETSNPVVFKRTPTGVDLFALHANNNAWNLRGLITPASDILTINYGGPISTRSVMLYGRAHVGGILSMSSTSAALPSLVSAQGYLYADSASSLYWVNGSGVSSLIK